MSDMRFVPGSAAGSLDEIAERCRGQSCDPVLVGEIGERDRADRWMALRNGEEYGVVEQRKRLHAGVGQRSLKIVGVVDQDIECGGMDEVQTVGRVDLERAQPQFWMLQTK